AEGHASEAISHALIAEDRETSRRFLELRDEIRKFRKWIQSSPVTRDDGIREIRKLRRQFEGFNIDYDVSKCETCGDPTEIMEDITKIIRDLKNNAQATAAHENEAEDFLVMEREMAEKVIAILSKKYGVEPPELIISDECHEPMIGLYTSALMGSPGRIMVCKTGVNLHVLCHEFWHHVQAKNGMHLDEGEAEKFAVEFCASPQKGLYANHNHSHTERKMVKTIKDVGIIYGLQQVGFGTDYALKWADTQMPLGFLGQPVSLWGDLAGTLGGILGALYLDEPYDLAAVMIGSYLSTDLWNHLIRLTAPATLVARPPPLVYTPGNVVKPAPAVPTPAAVAPGRYQITA
ncbi:unnamed protein product, partial [marine sediment metagenome]